MRATLPEKTIPGTVMWTTAGLASEIPYTARAVPCEAQHSSDRRQLWPTILTRPGLICLFASAPDCARSNHLSARLHPALLPAPGDSFTVLTFLSSELKQPLRTHLAKVGAEPVYRRFEGTTRSASMGAQGRNATVGRVIQKSYKQLSLARFLVENSTAPLTRICGTRCRTFALVFHGTSHWARGE